MKIHPKKLLIGSILFGSLIINGINVAIYLGLFQYGSFWQLINSET
jgi:hypothetical protein